MRIVFMGTPDFAVPSLRALREAGHEIAGCFCQPDRPSGRGKRLTACAVKLQAEAFGIPVFQFERIRNAEGVEALRSLSPDVAVTAAFGQILSRELLDIPRLGTVNVHASLLPKGRGAAPIQWSIINGEDVTGVTTMLTDEGVDTGDILLQRETPIRPEDTAGTLTERLAQIGGELITETIDLLGRGECPRRKQDHEAATRCPMLKKETGRVRWTAGARAIDCLARGTDPWPGAWTVLDGEVMKIREIRPVEGTGKPGTVLRADTAEGLVVACGDGAVRIGQLQMPGARMMDARDYLRGHRIVPGSVLEDAE